LSESRVRENRPPGLTRARAARKLAPSTLFFLSFSFLFGGVTVY
jgi:hypothetical protein